MKRVCVALGLAAGFCGAPAWALDLEPNTRAKAIAAATPAATAPASPKAALAAIVPAGPSGIALPDLQGGLDADGRTFSGACGPGKSEVCYDYREGRIVIRATRNWMPEFAGLTPEHISLRRNRIQFRYSFK